MAMQFQTPLIPGRLIRRYKRFLADIALSDGREVVVHCANTGPMTGHTTPGEKVWVEPNDDPRKKLDFGWRLLEHADGHFVGVDTSIPNRVVKEALLAGQVPELIAPEVRSEVKYGTGSRIDFLLSGAGPDIYVEVKSVTLMREAGLAEFPDTVTTRGAKHLRELAQVARGGARAVMFYLVQRTDSQRVAVAGDLDPDYGAAFAEARAAGVEVLAYDCRMGPEEVSLGRRLEFVG